MNFFERKSVLWCLFFTALLLLCLPYLLRLYGGNHIFIGAEPHYHARIAEFISENGIPEKDPLFSSPYLVNPYHLLLAGAVWFVPIEFASILVPVLLGFFSVIFFYLTLRELRFSKVRSFFVVLAFIFSPFFIAVFSLSTPFSLVFFLLFFGFFLFQKKQWFFFFASVFSLCLLALCGIIHALVVLLVLFVYCICAKKGLFRFYFVSVAFLLVGLVFHLPYYLLGGSISRFTSGIIAEFGSVYGFGVFSLLLGGLGLFFVWSYKTKYYLVYAVLILVFAVSFFVRDFLVYANIVVCFFAGIAFCSLYLREWELSDLKDFALLVVFCCLLFSSVSNIFVLSRLPPGDSLVDCFEWIGFDSSGRNSLVFAREEDGFFVEFWSGKNVLLDGLHSSDVLVRECDEIWHSSSMDDVKRFFSRKGVTYILIHEGLFGGNLWDEKGQELHFLLSNPETFKRGYANSYCEVWLFKGE